MVELQIRYTTGLACDKCDARYTFPEGPVYSYSLDLDAALEVARELGWKRYVGRSVRHYCPACEPSPKSKLERRELNR